MKQCTRCGKYLDESLFHADRSRECGLRPACKACCKAFQDKGKQKAYYQANKAARIDYGKRYYRDHVELAKTRAGQSMKKAIDTLSDTYIKHTLVKETGLKRAQIPQELVELKRLTMAIKRKVMEMTDEEC